MIIVDDIFIGAQPGTYSKVAIAVRDGHYCVASIDDSLLRIRRTTKRAEGSVLPQLESWNSTEWEFSKFMFWGIEGFAKRCKEAGLPEYAISEAVALML